MGFSFVKEFMLKEYTGPKFGPPHDGWHVVVHKDGSVKEVKAKGAFAAAQKAGWSLADVVDMRHTKCDACAHTLDVRYGLVKPRKVTSSDPGHSYVKEECYEASNDE